MSDSREFSENQKKKLEEYYNAPETPFDLEGKTIAAIKSKGLFRISNAAATYTKLIAGLAVLIIIFLAGYFIGHRSTTDRQPLKGKQQYLMLLFQPAGFVSNPSHAQEYAAWYNSLRAKQIMNSGEELKAQGWTIALQGPETAVNPLNSDRGPTGFFTYYASSGDEALKIASTCPHLKYKGSIELRTIEHHE